MLMGHPPQIIAWSREHAPQGRFEGLMPVQVSMVVEELVASNSEVQEALADPLEAVQKMAQAGPQAFHRVAEHTRAVRGTPSIRAGAMLDRPLVIVDLGGVQWEMLYSSVKHCAPPFTLAVMMGLIVAVRTFSSTAR